MFDLLQSCWFNHWVLYMGEEDNIISWFAWNSSQVKPVANVKTASPTAGDNKLIIILRPDQLFGPISSPNEQTTILLIKHRGEIYKSLTTQGFFSYKNKYHIVVDQSNNKHSFSFSTTIKYILRNSYRNSFLADVERKTRSQTKSRIMIFYRQNAPSLLLCDPGRFAIAKEQYVSICSLNCTAASHLNLQAQ